MPTDLPHLIVQTGRGRKRHHGDSSDYSSSDSSDSEVYDSLPYLPLRTPPPRYIRERIKRGKYVSFSRLLEKSRVSQGSKLPASRSRDVHDLASWLEAWNIYLPIRVAHDPPMALELVKYQGIICALFASFGPASGIGYDRLFRHHAAEDPSLRWDTLKEDIFVFQTNSSQKAPFRKQVFSRLGPQPDQNPNRESHAPSGVEICRRYNSSKCTLGDNCRFAHVCWNKGCGGSHPAKGCSHKQP